MFIEKYCIFVYTSDINEQFFLFKLAKTIKNVYDDLELTKTAERSVIIIRIKQQNKYLVFPYHHH